MYIESRKLTGLAVFCLSVISINSISFANPCGYGDYSYYFTHRWSRCGYSKLGQPTSAQTSSFNYQLPIIIGQVEKRDIASDFTVVQTTFALIHACFVPLRFALEKGGIYERQWQAIVPVFATDIVGGLIGGHLGGMICRAWISEYESEIRVFFKTVVAGLFAGAVWGGATSAAWIIASRRYRGYAYAEDYDKILYLSVGGGIVFSGIIHPVIVILRY